MTERPVIIVTPAQVDLAKLHCEVQDKLGEPRDPLIEMIANAKPKTPDAKENS